MKNVKELIQMLVDASLKQEEAETDANKWNPLFKQIKKIEKQLKDMGDEGVDKIIPLLDHENIFVRLNAAFFMIPTDPQKARETLLEISEQRGSIAFTATMVLREWDKGNLKF